MAAAQRLVAKQGDTLDLLIWREAGLGPSELTRILDANPGLVDDGSILPLGAAVTIPATTVAADAANTRVRPIIQLWD
ncbi:tail protein X [Sphingobium sp.]|uniref:tail protein X n=1 Tax=Sphingobium TaxID=165695 RepID=UPI001A34B1E0|nr:tail protein X [Sphingobium sp.]MBJ7376393.1 tail protein X [Sphingobium sp.]